MEIKRHNTFYMIHKALRAMMYDCALAIQNTDFTNPDEARRTFEKLKTVISQFDDHADHEDKFVMPPIEKFDAKTVEEFESEHVTDRRLGKSMMDLISGYDSLKTDDEKKICGLKLLYLFNEFVGFNLYHMNNEEDILNKILWANYSDKEILEMEGKIVQSIPPDKMMISIEWMFRGCSNNDLLSFLKPVKQNLPPPAFEAIMNVGKNVLSPERFKLVSSELNI